MCLVNVLGIVEVNTVPIPVCESTTMRHNRSRDCLIFFSDIMRSRGCVIGEICSVGDRLELEILVFFHLNAEHSLLCAIPSIDWKKK